MLNGAEPQGAYAGDYCSHYSQEQRERMLKIMRMARFMNSVGHTFSPKSSGEEVSAVCIIENKDYSRKKESPQGNKDHANVVAPPPVIFAIVLVAGLLVNKIFPFAVMSDPGTLLKSVGNVLFVLAGLIMVPTTMLMASKKTALRPDRKTTTIISSGFFKYSRNPLYLALLLIFFGTALYVNSVWLLLCLPVLLIALERGAIIREEEYLERSFGEEYLEYKQKVRRWI